MNRKIIAAVAIAAAASVAVWYASRPDGASQQLVLYGNVDLRQVALAFNRVERIASVAAEEGQQVRAGQVLAELDTATLELQLVQSRAQAEALQQVLRRLEAGSRPEEL